MTIGTYELTWIKQLLKDGVWEATQMDIVCENHAALCIASNLVFHKMTKH